MAPIIKDHPILISVLAFLFVSLPTWTQRVWGLFSKEPLIPAIQSKLKQINIPNFSIYWVTTSIGLLMLGFIVYKTTYPSESKNPVPSITTPKPVAISGVNTNWEDF